MDNHSLNFAAEIVQRSSRLQPADAVLRAELKRHKVPSKKARQISAAVFAYFRWFGWLDQKAPLFTRLTKAIELVERFSTLERGQPCPREFSDVELVSRVVPHWLSREMEITPDWARSLQSEPRLWLRARPGHGGELAAKLLNCVPFADGPLSDALEYRGDSDLFRTPEFHSGEFEVQDLSSQAVSLVCAPGAGETWWDACAGEGGKTLHLCDLMNNKGLVWASDRAEWRLQKLKRRAGRARLFNYRARVWDGGGHLPTKTKFDGVLVDAPCSGVGTWQRNPHGRWTTTLQDIEELSALQIKLLTHAAPAVKAGGKLIYAVCTLTRSETLEVVEAFEKRMPEFKALSLVNPLKPNEKAIPQLTLQPEEHGGNGMFIAGWIRV